MSDEERLHDGVPAINTERERDGQTGRQTERQRQRRRQIDRDKEGQ